jgi:hypothetical protein
MPAAPPQPGGLFRLPTAQEAELFRGRAALAAMREALAGREAELAHLRAQLNSFEGRYIRQVGVLYIQLDEWEQRIAELNSPPLSAGAGPESALDSADSLNPPALEPEATGPTQAFLNLKALFREVAKRIHPDFARDEDDAQHRTRLMAHANDAYNRDDAPLLHRMLHGYDPATGSGDAVDIVTELARVLVQIEQCERDTSTIEDEITALAQSEMADLRDRTALAATSGRDLLAELAARVKGSIGIAMRRYELDLGRARRQQPAFNPEALLTAETIERG